jgi:hypothetical protein
MNAVRIPTEKLRLLSPLLSLFLVLFAANAAWAQTGGEGAIQGTVTDPTGAVVPKATVTATDQASGVATSRDTSSAGLYEITPLIPGIYTVTVSAPGFEATKQENIEVNGLSVTGYNVKLALGPSNDTVTVTSAPPQLQTESATVGGVITNATYEALPDIMNNQQRDPTAFATLEPGAQAGARAPIMSGTGNYLAEVYLDGIPTTTSNQQGDNRTIVNAVPVEAVEQLQVVSGGPSAEYQGAGAISFTVKSGGSQYHGQAVDFVRNTIFDTWGFSAPALTVNTIVNGVATKAQAPKPIEHQNELSASVGGPIPFTHHKGFFFVNYDKYHGRTGVQPSLFTVPTTLMTGGNFTELGAGTYLYNPLSNSCNAGNTVCTRQPFMGMVNGVPTANVIPTNFISAISQYQQKFLPSPSGIAGIANNYLAGGISGYNNHELAFKVDYDLPHTQRLSFVFTHGVRQSVGYGANLPVPYSASDSSIISPTVMVLEHTIEITPNLVNQFNYGFTRFPQPVLAPTDGLAPYRGGPDVGITGLPTGQASDNFPGSTFSTTTQFPTGISQWTENGAADASHNVVPNAFTLVDNLHWVKGRHSMTFGLQTQWLEDNTTAQSSPSGIYTQTFTGASTANYVGNKISTTATGYSYADFLLGAVNAGATSVPLIIETAGRFHPFSPYFQDDWKVRSNLTINLGLRWDYLPPYREAHDNWSFFNTSTSAPDPLTNTPGQLEFAGNRGSAISCQCRTPVQTYWKNFGPRVGFEWSADKDTVFRGGFAIAFSRAGGVGGRGGDSTGASQAGFGSNIILNPAVSTGSTAAPSYWLNTNSAFMTANLANTNFGGPGYTIPAPIQPNASELTQGIGNYVSNGAYVTPGGAPGYADPYLSGRAPEFEFYNFGIQKVITSNLTITVNYAGSESHFVAGAGVPGFWSGQIDPAHVALTGSTLATDNATNILNAQATAANIAIAQAADPSIVIPTWYAQAGAISTTPTIGRALRPYPKYSSPPSPQWDNIANLAYNSVQISLAQREYKGLSFNLNYTYGRNYGDDGTTRSAYAVPAAASSSGYALPGNNRADRDLTTIDTPQILNIYGLDQLPFGKGHIGGHNFLVRTLLGGWAVSGIFSYTSGNPLLVTASGCTTPSSGTCEPDLVPGMQNNIRQNGSWGKGVTGANLGSVKFLNSAAFSLPNAFPLPANAKSTAVAITKIGDAPRTHLNLWGPSKYNLNAAVRRSFNITPERVKFIFEAECFDVTNKVTFGGINTTWSAASTSTFGEVTSVSGNRDFQFSGRVTF